ncbi:MCE family protein [bacterium]|nr:MCE family protein [bacterium]
MLKITAKTEYQKNIAKFLELLIWILFFSFFAGLIIFYNWYSHTNYNRYHIFLQDVDGIIVGSPVRMSGIQVGYVKHIKFVNDMVYVDFIINQKGIEVPKGSKITVEFNGLGGSKSLEIYTPKQAIDENTPNLVIQQPRRLGAAVSLLNSMLKKIGDIIYRTTYFAESLEFDEIEHKPKNKNNISEKEMLHNIEKWIDKTQMEIDKKNNRK